MAVWVPDSETSARPAPYPTLATTAKVTVSGKSNKSLRAINDGEEPTASDDPSSYFDWWPVKGAQELVEYAFEKPAKSGNEWKPVLAVNAYGVEKDQYNRVLFAPVTTSGLRLELSMQPKWSAGFEKWEVR